MAPFLLGCFPAVSWALGDSKKGIQNGGVKEPLDFNSLLAIGKRLSQSKEGKRKTKPGWRVILSTA